MPPCGLTDNTFASAMELSPSQKETKESFDKQDSRGGGLAGLDKTAVWRSWKQVGTGDILKSPRMGHWQHNKGWEL